MQRKLMVVGNWKMNKVYVEGLILANTVMAGLEKFRRPIQIVLCPPFIHLQTVASMYKEHPQLAVGAQNCYQAPQGAYTGEVSAAMLRSVGVEYVIIGHSERREQFNEKHPILAEKLKSAIAAGLQPIFCCGEWLAVREAEDQEAFVQQQLEESLFGLSEEEFSKVIIAYEPVWAIGTGLSASPEQAQAMHRFIRNLIAEKYGDNSAQNTTILYGGSCNAENAAALFAQADIDGALVGGASLKAEDFLQIVEQRAAIFQY